MPGSHVITVDPLSQYADPKVYVSLPSGERALAEIEASLREGRSPVLLSGPAGVGKTMLLSVLAERERAFRVSVRFARSLAHPPEAIGSWLLRLLFGKSASNAGDAELALLEQLRAFRDKPILLLVDEIQLAPIGSVRKLAALARGGAPALAIVVCGSDGTDLQTVTAMLAPKVTVSLPESLPELEIEALYDAILAHPGLSPRVLHRLKSVARADIVRAASGRPGLLRAELTRHDPRSPAREQPRPTPVKAVADPARATVSVVTEPAAATKPGRPTRERIRAVSTRLVRPVVRVRRAARAMLALLIGALAYVGRVPGAIGLAAHRGVGAIRGASTALLRLTTDSLAHSAAWLAESVAAAGRAARRSIWSGRARLTRSRARIGCAARETAHAALRAAVVPLRSSAEATRRARDRVLATGREQVARISTELGAAARAAEAHARDRFARTRASTGRVGAALLVRSHARVARAATRVRATTREAGRQSIAAAAAARRAALRAGPVAALPATALVAVAVLSLYDYRVDSTAQLGRPAPVTDVAGESPVSSPVNVQVNARPWATVRIDGVDLGATPLSHRLAPGVYQLEAVFPDGKRIEREIDVGPDRRFVSLP